MTRLVLESALEGEITDHLGYDKRERGGSVDGNSRNGTRAKTVLTKAGPVQVDVPRDRQGTFEPRIVAKRQRRLGSIEDIVLSLSARGMTHGDISAHLADVYGSEVSKTTISTITDKVLEGMSEWQNRPLDPARCIRWCSSTASTSRSVTAKSRTVLSTSPWPSPRRATGTSSGCGAGDGGEGAKYWLQVLTEIKNRGVGDVLMVVCDGLTGLPDAVNTVWKDTIVQTCIVHPMRNSFKYSARQ